MPVLNYGLRLISDFPCPGIQFIDINGLLADPKHFTAVIDKMCAAVQHTIEPDLLKTAAIISPESRGFFFSAPVAYHLGLPLLPIRKKGKIPNNPYRFHITNEYDSYDMEIDGDLLERFEHFIYIDDILATGQTLASVRAALQTKNKQILQAIHLTSVKELQSVRDKNPQLDNLHLQEII